MKKFYKKLSFISIVIFLLIFITILFNTKIFSFKETMIMDENSEVITHLKDNILANVRPSKIHGVGLFALNDLNVGDNLYSGHSENEDIIEVEEDELKELLNEEQYKYICNMSNSSDNENITLIPDSHVNMVPISKFMNHSYNPNMEWNNKIHAWIVIKDIKKDEEMFHDYTKTSSGKNLFC